jgi:hypothetical protein
MGSSDGTLQGIAKILDNGPDASRMNVVLVAEGFTAAQEGVFDSLCNDFVAALQAETWYPILGNAINVHRLRVHSDESGVDEPNSCPDGASGSGTSVDTYFDATFCNSNIWRCMRGDYNLVRLTLNTEFGGNWHVAIVLANTTDHGGCANDNVSFTHVGPGWENTALHEMGHNFGLADEYHYWAGCDTTETNCRGLGISCDHAPAGEPEEPNVTTETSRDALKWRHLLSPGVPVPTMENPDCSNCDDRPNVLSDDDAVGLYEGAKYFHCGRYRGAYRCRMRNSGESFCRVCVEAIAAELNEYIPATPTMEVAPLVLDFGDVAYGLTLYLPFEVRNVRTGRPGAIDVSVSAPTGGFAFAPDTETSFTLPAPIFEAQTERRVYVAFTAPTSGGPSSGQVTVTRTDDPSATPVVVTLQANAVPPPPVDSVLVIDRSGSMSGASGTVGMSKMEMSIEAANLYVSLLKDNDQIGIVRYNDASGASDVLLNMIVAGDETTGTGRANARSVLTPANLHPDDSTSIGAGIINGSSVLDGGTADARALVVLTDGRQNTSPDIPAGTAVVLTKTPRQRVFAVGLGLNQLEDRLHQIASVTNGTAQITGDLVDEREFLLQKLYVQILSDVGEEAFVRDPRQIANPGDRQSTTIHIGEVDVAADFVVVYRRTNVFPKYLKLELEAPDGTLFTPWDLAPLPNAEYVQRPGHAYFRWQFPTFPDKPDQHKGAWKVWVENLAHGEYFNAGILVYSVMAKARSDLRLGGRVIQADYKPGSQMEIVLEPTLFGLPVELNAPVRVRVTRPDGVVRTVTLSRDEYGAYRSTFADTGLVGPYQMRAEVSVTTPAGHRVTRYRQMTGLIFVPGQSGDGYRPDDKLCREARRALKILHEIIERCCRERKKKDDLKRLRSVSKKHLVAEIARRLDDDQV